MDDPTTPEDVARRLAEVQDALLALPEDAFAERYELLKQRDALRERAAEFATSLDDGRSDEDLLTELAALREQRAAIESQRIDLVTQAGSGGPGSGEMGNLGGVGLNRGIGDAMGLPGIEARIGVIKGVLTDRGVDVPEAD